MRKNLDKASTIVIYIPIIPCSVINEMLDGETLSLNTINDK